MEHLTWLVQRSVEDAGPGAWMEQKPTGVVLHVRQADPDRGQAARDALIRSAADLDGAVVKPGSAVVELMARPADKGIAVRMLRDRHRAAAIVFAGDDVTDEDGFRVLADGDLGIKVGPGETAATRRLADSDVVRDWLRALATGLT